MPMSVRTLFPRLLTVLAILGLVAITSFAQDSVYRPRKVVTAMDPHGASRLETETVPDVLPFDVIPSRLAPSKSISEFASPAMARFNNLLHGAIDQRLGAPYSYGAIGPSRFDCSGFVWSAFQAVGITFERASARSLWTEFEPAKDTEKFKFGTLVFFNGLNHIGIVADENGFYHASRSHGVTYSPFSKYWAQRIDGFRRVPAETPILAE